MLGVALRSPLSALRSLATVERELFGKGGQRTTQYPYHDDTLRRVEKKLLAWRRLDCFFIKLDYFRGHMILTPRR